MNDLQAALTEALRSEFSEWVEPDDVDEIAWDYKAAAILARPAMADLAAQAAVGQMLAGYLVGHSSDPEAEWCLKHLPTPAAIAAALGKP